LKEEHLIQRVGGGGEEQCLRWVGWRRRAASPAGGVEEEGSIIVDGWCGGEEQRCQRVV
jgi:hypothetical protein